MNWWQHIIATVVAPWVLGELGKLLGVIVRRSNNAVGRDSETYHEAKRIAVGIETSHPSWSDEKKRRHALDAMRNYTLNRGYSQPETAWLDAVIAATVMEMKDDAETEREV